MAVIIIMEDDRWFVRRRTIQLGPYPLRRLRRAARNSTLRPDDLVRQGDFADWVRADSISSLFEQASSPGFAIPANPFEMETSSSPRAQSRPAGDGWFVRRGAARLGPYPFHRLRRAAQNSKLRADDLVGNDGFADWVRADSMGALFEQPSSAVSASPAPPAGIPEDGSPQETGTKDSGATEPTKSRANYLVRQWRGDFSLPVSYWVNGALVTLAIIPALTAINNSKLSDRLGIYGTGLWILFVLGFVAALTVWQAIGTWRSAEKHVARGGSAGWAVTARVMIVLGTIQAAGAFVTQIPLIRRAAAMLVHAGETPHYQIRLLRNPTEIELSGGLSNGTAAAVKTVLEATPNVKLIHLNNSGGGITEGLKLAELIESYGLVTFTSRSCVNACMIAFIAGKDRYLGETGRLGFHSAGAEGANNRQFYLRHGVTPAFVDRLTSPAASGTWYPTRDELISAHVITAIVEARDYVSTPVADWRNAAIADNQLAEVPALAAIKRRDPLEYARIKQELIAGMQAGDSERELLAIVHARMQNLLRKYLRTGPDQELVAYWRIQLAELSELQNIDPTYCVRFLFPEAGRLMDIQNLVSQDVRNAEAQTLSALIDAAAVKPAKTPTEAEILPLLSRSMVLLEHLHPDVVKMVAKPEVSMSKPTALCDAELNFYRYIVALPTAQSGALLRYLSSV
ncbi:MAG: GYF domain-containing protein [Steroidobacteraceae bacterium]